MTTSAVPDALTCSAQARVAHEPLPGTAPEAVGWLLVEQQGAWGRDALRESGLDHHVATELDRAAAALPVRVQAIRRPGYRRGVQRTVILAHAGPGTSWMRRLAIGDPRQLLDLDLASLLSPTPPTLGEPEDGPVLLVCTHAKRDQCCALWGRPLVDHLAGLAPEQVWETSHVGGHRFAGNLVVLPEGNVHGYLDAVDGERVLARYLDGEVDTPTLRGRSSLPRAAQAAEVFARQHAGVDTLGGVDVSADADAAAGRVTVTIGSRRFLVEVAMRPLEVELLTGCDKDAPTDPGRHVLVDIREVA